MNSYKICNPPMTADQAVSHIQSGMRIYITGNCSFPRELMGALVRRAPELQDVEIAQVLTVGNSDYIHPSLQGHIRVNALFISDNVRPAVNDGRADYTPCRLSDVPALFHQDSASAIRRNVPTRIPARRAWFLLAWGGGGREQRRGGTLAYGDRRSEPAYAAHTGR